MRAVHQARLSPLLASRVVKVNVKSEINPVDAIDMSYKDLTLFFITFISPGISLEGGGTYHS